ncbi:DUF2263 domain-containing protein [Blastopirellula sp. JC732]|uniref:DUF2263 domain-containing protein n=1 Tax=Blastopirellula sediminis TaxID=2894196 RepID=A0A9X1MJH7_9BACT|nr:poly(ADP-ribose) glycohydrolase domain-containing protein [Blastopirellula sediminis]MCC9608140.1 DUF2263 domain-containing protein [Blastopirellula sediminis]MCC9627067.1 DUF2263 domain-containing protein [Blastopirellula sediminis]
MPGRPFCSDIEAMYRGFLGWECTRRREVLQETIAALEKADPSDHYHRLAQQNLKRWRASRADADGTLRVEVISGDWGDVVAQLTREYGECFAALNMANSYVPGGAYVEGAAAQEENMFRRTDCHFRIRDDQYDPKLDQYFPEMTRLLTAHDGEVYLDTLQPRVCIRGSEDRGLDDLGYPWLADEAIFPFYELRAAACDLRDGSPFEPEEMRRRIVAQLDTLQSQGVRHAVLGAFGCGAFMNPATEVAKIYQEEIAKRADDFAVIAFAIYSAGYGPDNYKLFANVFGVE